MSANLESPETQIDEPAPSRPPVPYEQLGKPIAGPSALIHDYRRIWHLTYNIAVMQWKQRFFGSVLGYLWQLIRPLLLFLVLYLFFTKVSHVGQGQGPAGRYEGAQLLASIVLFTFFQEATAGAVRGVVDNETFVRKIQFPRIVIPLSIVLLAIFNLCLNMIVVCAFALAEGVRPMMTWFELPLIVGMLVVLCTGIAMLLSAGYVYFRDLQPIWEVFNQVIFYATPIILPVLAVKQHLAAWLFHLYMFNPLAVVFQQFRHAFINHATPSSGALLGSMTLIAVPVVFVIVVFVVGFWTFNRIAPRVAEDL